MFFCWNSCFETVYWNKLHKRTALWKQIFTVTSHHYYYDTFNIKTYSCTLLFLWLVYLLSFLPAAGRFLVDSRKHETFKKNNLRARPLERSTCVLVENLPALVNKTLLEQIFEQWGPVEDVFTIPSEHAAIITFKEEEGINTCAIGVFALVVIILDLLTHIYLILSISIHWFTVIATFILYSQRDSFEERY